MDQKVADNIPEIGFDEYKNENSQVVVLDLGELNDFYYEIITNPHRINYFQMLFIIEGNGTLRIDSHQYDIESKAIYAVSKGQVQSMEYKHGTKGMALFFSEEFINKYPQDVGWINNLTLFDLNFSNPVVQLPETEYLELLIIISKMKSEISMAGTFARDEILLNLLKTFLLIAERIKRTGAGRKPACEGEQQYLAEFKKKLEENYSSSRSVQYYAELLNVTNRKLNRIVLENYGKSTKRVIEERVLLEIKRQLIHTGHTVKEIGHSLGFSDPTNFIKFFKKYAKVTPSEYRVSFKKTQLYYK